MIIISSVFHPQRRIAIKIHAISAILSTWRILYEFHVGDLYWTLSPHSPFCVRSDVNKIHYPLRDHIRTYVYYWSSVVWGMSNDAQQKKTRCEHFTFYEASRGKQDISPFTRSVQEIGHSQRGRRNSRRSKHNYRSRWEKKKEVSLFRLQGKYSRIILFWVTWTITYYCYILFSKYIYPEKNIIVSYCPCYS